MLVEQCDCICLHVYGSSIPATIDSFVAGNHGFVKKFSGFRPLFIGEFEVQNFRNGMPHYFFAGPTIHLFGGTVPGSNVELVVCCNDSIVDMPEQTGMII